MLRAAADGILRLARLRPQPSVYVIRCVSEREDEIIFRCSDWGGIPQRCRCITDMRGNGGGDEGVGRHVDHDWVVVIHS